MTQPDTLPLNEMDRKFEEPWQAQIFALTLHLHEQGVFTWNEWADYLSCSIKHLDTSSSNHTTTYYLQWLDALEQICYAKTGLTYEQLLDKKDAWEQAYLNTPHGKAVTLPADKS